MEVFSLLTTGVCILESVSLAGMLLAAGSWVSDGHSGRQIASKDHQCQPAKRHPGLL